MKNEFVSFLSSPIGALKIVASATHITAVQFVMDIEAPTPYLPEHLLRCQQELGEYFNSTRKVFTVPTQPDGTAFQQLVWAQLQHIPYGHTTSYSEIARRINKGEQAGRAVGHANGQNPIAIIIPCHRVIGENGTLTGYAGGLWRKEWLLQHEGRVAGTRLRLFN